MWGEHSSLSVMRRVAIGPYSAMVLLDTAGVWTVRGRSEQEAVHHLVPHLPTVTLQVNTPVQYNFLHNVKIAWIIRFIPTFIYLKCGQTPGVRSSVS